MVKFEKYILSQFLSIKIRYNLYEKYFQFNNKFLK